MLKINVVKSKTIQLADTKPGPEQNSELVLIFPIAFTAVDIVEEQINFLLGKCRSRGRIILNDFLQCKIKRVFQYDFIIAGHLECVAQYRLIIRHRGIFASLIQFYHELFCAADFDELDWRIYEIIPFQTG